MTPPIDIRPDHLETVRAILREHLPRGVEVWAFGSRADWTTKDSSDLDLALEGDGPLDPGIVMALELAFEESLLPFSVDVVDIERVEEGFREIVFRGRVGLSYVSDGGSSYTDRGDMGFTKETTLGRVAEIVMGQSPPGSTYNETNNGLPFFQGVRDFGYRFAEPRVFCSKPSRVAQPGDILLSVRAPIGRVNVADRQCAIGRGLAIVRPRANEDSRYLEFVLRSIKSTWHAIEGSGSVFGNATKRDLESLPVRWPGFGRERAAVAQVLGAIDDRIELNRRMNATLEAMARALFKSWFVDFDPVRAKMEGRGPGLPPEIAELFPDRLVESELGEIPEGWEVRTLGSCFELTMGQSPPGHTYNDAGIGLPFFQGRKDFGFRFPRRRQYCNEPTRIARPDDTLVSVRAPVGDINMAFERCCVGRGLAALRHRSGSPSYTYYSALAMQLALQTFEGTGTVFGAITKGQFNGKLVLEPPADLVTAFDAFAGPTDDQIRTTASSLEGLTQVRDTLLPKLVSGEVRLPATLVERYGEPAAPTAA